MQFWEQHKLAYPIFFLTYVSSSTIDYVKSFLEWMSDSIAKSFEHTRDNAFLLRYDILLSIFFDLFIRHIITVVAKVFCEKYC